MNKKIRRIISLVFSFVILVSCKVNAVSLTGSSNVNVGETFTVTFNFETNVAAYDKLSVTYDDKMLEYVSGDSLSQSYWWDDSDESQGITTKTYTFKAKNSGASRIKVEVEGAVSANETMDELGTLVAEKMVNVAAQVQPEPQKPTDTQGSSGNVQPDLPSASGNNYLKYLQISEEGLTPYFTRNVTDYAITVGENVNDIEVLARAEDSNARVEISGNKGLVDGDNIISIKVTAENGYYRIYKIIVTKTADVEKSNAYLENIIVEGYTLNKTFQSEVLEYDIGEISSTVEFLNVVAITKDKDAKVEIIGADSLAELGKGEIIIKVIAPNGTTIREYKITYTVKEATQDEITEKQMIGYLKDMHDGKSKKEVAIAYLKYIWTAIKKNYLLVIMYVLVVFEFIHILILRKKAKRAKEESEELHDKTILEIKNDNDKTGIPQAFAQEENKIEPPKVELLSEEVSQKTESVELPKLERSGSRAEDIQEEQNKEGGIKLVDLDKNDGPQDELTFNIFENLNDDDIKRMLEEQIDKD